MNDELTDDGNFDGSDMIDPAEALAADRKVDYNRYGKYTPEDQAKGRIPPPGPLPAFSYAIVSKPTWIPQKRWDKIFGKPKEKKK